MKQRFALILLLLSGACSHNWPDGKLLGPMHHNEVQTYRVSMSDVLKFVSITMQGTIETKSLIEQDISILPVVDIEGDTVFYAVNYNPGWKLLSSDKRTPIVLAEGDEGEFDINSLDSYVADWLEAVAEDIRLLKRTTQTIQSKSSESDQIDFPEIWSHITSPETVIGQSAATKVPPCYELYSRTIETEVTHEVPHLIPVAWHQSAPFNDYCPFKSDGSGNRAPAGCVAIAGAQMLYYLHGRLGRPMETPSSGYCYGVLGNYSQGFSDFSSLPLGDMFYNTVSSSLLIGFVGQAVDMDYGNVSSSAHTSDLVEVFDGFGISCDYDSYDPGIVAAHLQDSIPVILRADGTRKTFLGIPYYENGHAFIVDGFREIRYKYTDLYVWAYTPDYADSLGYREYDFDNSYTQVSYSSPIVNQIKINWGFGAVPSYNYWFTMTGNWHVTETDPDCDFDYRRHMVYNFSVMQ